MIKKLVLISLVVLIGACSVSGKYRSDGPCEGFNKDPEACERAAANSLVIGKVQLGQTPKEVREIMETDPEHREANEGIETWGYRTNYNDRLFTGIVFESGKVKTIKQYTQ